MRSALLLSVCLVAACKPPPKTKSSGPPLCSAARPLTKTNKFRSMRADDWFNLLVDRAADGSNADCTGTPLTWSEPQGCLETAEASTPAPAQPFKEEDVIVTRVDEATKLVWVMTDRFSNGDAQGPVALVEEGAQTMDVVSLGTLRSKGRRPRLKMITVGKSEVLTAEGEVCEREDDPASCRRSISLLQRQGKRFVPLRLHARNGMCLGPAVIHMKRQKLVPLDSGWTRRLELNSTLQAQPARILVTEQVVVSDFDPTRPGVPPRPVRRADAEILLWFAKDGRLLASDASLWSRVLEQVGKEEKGEAPQ
jgi:hypothetical protein